MKMKRILASVTAVIMATVAMVGCGASPSENNSAEEKDTLILGCDINFAPMAFEQDGEIVGFDIDLAREVIEEKMGMKLEIQPIDWDSKEAELDTGKVDIVWNGLTITDDREKNMCLTQAYMENKQVIIVAEDTDISSSSDLTGKRIAMQKESSAVDAYKYSGIEGVATELKDNVACLDELASGRQDAVVMDSVVADYYLTKNAERYPFTILDESLADEEYAIAVKKGNDDLKKQIEDAMKECIDDGSAAEISKEWFGSDKILPFK